ncbi:MAG: ThiF family adenylyltransferase [Campylobacterales bacterium]
MILRAWRGGLSDRFERLRPLFGDKLATINEANILLLGVGGVGSFCLDCLWRSGVTKITIVDSDCYEPSNQNRQIGAEAVGEVKVAHLAKLFPGITPIHTKITPEWVEVFDFEPYDLVLDAIDDLKAKVAIARRCYKKLISATGSAKRLDPTMIQVGSIWKSYGDPFAKKFRDELKKARFNRNFLVIFSPETPRCQEKGSFVGVTGAFGLTLCAQAIKRLMER